MIGVEELVVFYDPAVLESQFVDQLGVELGARRFVKHRALALDQRRVLLLVDVDIHVLEAGQIPLANQAVDGLA